MRAIFAASIASNVIGTLAAPLARAIEAAFARTGTAMGRSSNEFHASHCGHRPSHLVDSNPHALQKKTDRVFATAPPSSTLRVRLVFSRRGFLEYFAEAAASYETSRRESRGGTQARGLSERMRELAAGS
jgi:hypothetical protein